MRWNQLLPSMIKPTTGFELLPLLAGKGEFEAKASRVIALAKYGIKTESIIEPKKGSAIVAAVSLLFWHLPRFMAMWCAAKLLSWIDSRNGNDTTARV